MGTFLAIIKAIITRLVFAAHGFIAIWQVTLFKRNNFYWYLSSPILLLVFEGLFTLAIKENQEWKWFCPSVFLYLLSVIPSIWILELEKIDKRVKAKEDNFNLTATAKNNLKELNDLIGVEIRLPEISLSADTWITVIEQFLMLILIIGRWMLPKGELTRDQLSQLLLVYIGTAADIIEFFDSFKDDKVVSHPILVLLTLSIWSWSLMQFTVVLTATKSRKSRLATASSISTQNCCGIDVWGIVLNITLQDAPFLVFRLLLITHFNIISYMNIFFTCKNSLVIVLQLYRLHVVYSENKKNKKKRSDNFELGNISIISKGDIYRTKKPSGKTKKDRESLRQSHEHSRNRRRYSTESEKSAEDEYFSENEERTKRTRTKSNRKDTGYSTGSSLGSTRKNVVNKSRRTDRENSKCRHPNADDIENQSKRSKKKEKQKLTRTDKDTKGHRKEQEALSEESQSDRYSENEKKRNLKNPKKKQHSKATSSSEMSSD